MYLLLHVSTDGNCQNSCIRSAYHKTTAVNMNWNLKRRIARMVDMINGFSYSWPLVYFQLYKVPFFICGPLVMSVNQPWIDTRSILDWQSIKTLIKNPSTSRVSTIFNSFNPYESIDCQLSINQDAFKGIDWEYCSTLNKPMPLVHMIPVF